MLKNDIGCKLNAWWWFEWSLTSNRRMIWNSPILKLKLAKYFPVHILGPSLKGLEKIEIFRWLIMLYERTVRRTPLTRWELRNLKTSYMKADLWRNSFCSGENRSGSKTCGSGKLAASLRKKLISKKVFSFFSNTAQNLLLYCSKGKKHWCSNGYRNWLSLTGQQRHSILFRTYFLYTEKCRLDSHALCGRRCHFDFTLNTIQAIAHQKIQKNFNAFVDHLTLFKYFNVEKRCVESGRWLEIWNALVTWIVSTLFIYYPMQPCPNSRAWRQDHN